MEIKKVNSELGFEILPSTGRKITVISKKNPEKFVVMELCPRKGRFEYHVERKTGRIFSTQERIQALPPIHKIVFPSHELYLEIQHKLSNQEEEHVFYYLKNLETHEVVHWYSRGGFNFSGYDDAEGILDKYLNQKDPERFFKNQYKNFLQNEKIAYWVNQILMQDRMQGGYSTQYKKPLVPFLCKEFVDSYRKFDDQIEITMDGLAEWFGIDISIARELVKLELASALWKTVATEANLLV